MGETKSEDRKEASVLADSEITFVYLGDKLPRYAFASLKLLAKYNEVRATLLCSRSLRKSVPEQLARVIPLEGFYDGRKFESVSSSISSPKDFRAGFWHKTFERFFVLQQYGATYARKSIFHAELDQLFFGVERLISALTQRSEQGLFFPFHTSNTGIASVFFSNSPKALGALVNDALTSKTYPDEMHFLADWADRNPSMFYGLPTIADYQIEENTQTIDLSVADYPGFRGAVDGVQIGQWVAGIDPRNLELGELSRTKFPSAPNSHLLSNESLNNLTFSLNEQNLLVVAGGGTQHLLFNLHIHSKIHPYLKKNDRRVRSLINAANSPKRFLVPGAQIRAFESAARRVLRVLQKGLTKKMRRFRAILLHQRVRVIRFIRWRPSSRPYLSGDTFRALADGVWEKQKRADLTRLPEGSVVFCEGDLVSDLADSAQQSRAKGLVLILGNSDTNHFTLEHSLTESGLFRKVFAQNLMEEHPFAIPLPIGLENRFRQHHGIPRNFTRIRGQVHVGAKKPRIMWSFNKNTNPQEREPAERALQNSAVADHVGWLTPSEHLRSLSLYSFVACPAGNGLDTHRVWEAMYMHCVPIVTRSYAFEYFEGLGMPLWIVDSFKELEQLQEADLVHTYQTLLPRFCSSTLWLPYWERLIKDSNSDRN